LTVRPAPVEAAPVAASRANAPDEVTNEPSARAKSTEFRAGSAASYFYLSLYDPFY